MANGHTLADYRRLIDEHGIAVSLDLPGDLPQVHADPDRFLQVMLNLLSTRVAIWLIRKRRQ